MRGAVVTGVQTGALPIYVLISDAGLRSTVLLLRARSTEPPPMRADPDGIVWLDGAADWPGAAYESARLGWHGLESMVGIPGTVGGAVVQSIGAYGYELRDIVTAVRAVDLTTSTVIELYVSDIGFAYRESALKRQPHRRSTDARGVGKEGGSSGR